MEKNLQLAAGSIVVGLAVLGLKYLAFAWTGSVALYSDAVESVINVVAAVAALIAVWYGGQPADENHPFGHHKAEYFSAVLEGALIIVAALAIAHEAYGAFLAPRTIRAPLEGLLVNGLATALNALWCWILLSRGRKLRSPALVADGKHLLSDVISSGGVVLGVALAAITGWAILDPALAIVVALNILWSGWGLIRDSTAGLMDAAVTPQQRATIQRVISENADGAIEAHDLRTRAAGSAIFIELHLVVPGAMSVEASHAICDRIENALGQAVHGAVVTIHVEPEGKAKHRGIPVLAPSRHN
ncbi:Cobaltzinccadmium resistance protein [Bradyrhizobium sp.]|uniref:cation diffusion facilitator family transporter n=1 Tax=Bradyrhizobium sp. TaxID=376 RepID=UPI0007C1F45F|nr:cation diffusion facilitator family transporter [Bradyrhizobium sp.]CUT13495.1 Cobaltzinccadmium resistance protein [Bradyrhizobium sp.]